MQIICTNNAIFENSLTKYKIYEVNYLSDHSSWVWIKNDNNEIIGYSKDRFMTMKTYRKLKIKKINESNL